MSLLTVDYQAPDAPEQFVRSLRDCGFVVLKNHPLDWSLIESIYAEWRSFFESEAKLHYPGDPDNYDGYFGADISEIAKGNTVKDIKEYYSLFFPSGRYPQEVSDQAKRYYQAATHLAQELLEWLHAGLPETLRTCLPTSLPELMCFERSLYRIIYYPALSGTEEAGAERAAPHEDINFITVLPIASEAGLQIKDQNGQWIDVPLNPETLVINAGDMLQEISGFYYKSTTHRVLNPTGEAARHPRISTPLFVPPKMDTFLSERYRTAHDYLMERFKENGVV